MKSDILVCSAWRDAHERPVYTLRDTCPECGADAENSAPPPFDPEDRWGEYRRRAKRRAAEGDVGADDDSADDDGDGSD